VSIGLKSKEPQIKIAYDWWAWDIFKKDNVAELYSIESFNFKITQNINNKILKIILVLVHSEYK
jgi:hypothetical protein